MTRASAIAHPIQGLVKYHGLADMDLRIPYHASISLCTAPTRTHTTVELVDQEAHEVWINGIPIHGRALERCVKILETLRLGGGRSKHARVVSVNNFPEYVGLGSSSSGFAALTLAAMQAYGHPMDPKLASMVARLGAGSATRSVAGGWAEWVTDTHDDRSVSSYGTMLAGPTHMPWECLAVVVQHDVPTEDAHRDADTSPFFQARLTYLPDTLRMARAAIHQQDPERLMAIAEQDTLNLHAATMTTSHGLIAWRGLTIETIHLVRRLRKEGIKCWFSIDTGATVYVNTTQDHVDTVHGYLDRLVRDHASKSEPQAYTQRLRPAGPATLTEDHLETPKT